MMRINKVLSNKEKTTDVFRNEQNMDSNIHSFIDINKAVSIIMNFIGTDEFNKIVSAIEDNAKAGFIAGLSFATCIEMAKCKRFYAKEGEADG